MRKIHTTLRLFFEAGLSIRAVVPAPFGSRRRSPRKRGWASPCAVPRWRG